MFKKVMNALRIVFCTFPDPETARQIGTLLVKKQLAACMTMIPRAESIYRWQGKVECEPETLTMTKTTTEAWPMLEQELTSLHPYDVPEIVAVEPEQVTPAYALWIGKEVGGTEKYRRS